ncbi:DUF2207 domain-containing protein [Tissierella creatinini]|nr:DUF2207 domain-containing protein [Tissierella creatinini]TJX67268.1 DUF2207 domain-containing protein [Soehngenia saccharolytica]
MKRSLALILILIFIVAPINVHAEESLEISNWIVSSKLLENGNLQIIEDITYDFNDEFNGVYRDINLEGMDGIGDYKIYEVTSGDSIEYLNDQDAKIGDAHVFSYNMENSTIRFMIYSPSRYVEKTFRLSYTLKNVAVIHEDTGELYFKYLGDENQTFIHNFSASLKLPQMDREAIKIFGHGPLNGTINFTDDNLIKLDVSQVPPLTFIEARILYPKEYTPMAMRLGESNINAILDEEASFLQEIEQESLRRQERKILLNKISLAITVLGAAITGFFIILIRRDKEIDTNLNHYPEEISPAELNRFMTGYMNSRGLMATLFDLARREYITIDELNKDDKNLSKKELKYKDYEFERTNKNDGDLLDHERYILDWLFNEVGNGNRVSTYDIDILRKKETLSFNKNQTKWSKLVKEQLKSRGYTDSKSTKIGIVFILISIPLIIISIISLVFGGLYGILASVISLMILIFGSILAARKSDKGYIQYKLWKDFKKEFENYSEFDIGIPKDKVLIYAVALGFSMKDLDKNRLTFGTDYYPMYWGPWYFNSINKKGGSGFEDRLNRSFYGNASTSSATSTNFGGGGGFSGGGGGGAGGGGSGGF